jgi:hypothetical protein
MTEFQELCNLKSKNSNINRNQNFWNHSVSSNFRPVFMKFMCEVQQRNTWTFALTVRRLWGLWRPSKRPHWYNSAKRSWMISLPSMPWGCIGCPDMLGYKEMKLPTSSQQTVLFGPALGVSRQNIRRKIVRCWLTNIGKCGEFLVTLRDRLEE